MRWLAGSEDTNKVSTVTISDRDAGISNTIQHQMYSEFIVPLKSREQWVW